MDVGDRKERMVTIVAGAVCDIRMEPFTGQ